MKKLSLIKTVRQNKSLNDLRDVAGVYLKKNKPDTKVLVKDFKDLLEEVSIYQIELEMQNTNLRRIEIELEDKNQKYESLYEFAPCGYLTLNSKRQILQANLKASDLLGVPVDQLVGEDIVTFFAPEDQSKVVKYYKQVKLKPNISSLKSNNQAPIGLYVDLQSEAQVNQPKGGILYKTILIDCSERIKMQQKLNDYQMELESNVMELNKKNTALNEILSQFETGKARIEKAVTFNAKKLLLPLINRLRKKEDNKTIAMFELLEKNVKQIGAEFGLKISEGLTELSPQEILICNMIREGFGSKEIASSFNISLKTVETHRRNIRKKLSLSNKEVNLATYLNSI